MAGRYDVELLNKESLENDELKLSLRKRYFGRWKDDIKIDVTIGWCCKFG